MALPERFPKERASASSDNVDRHGVEFIEQEFRSVGEEFPGLYSPSGVILRGGIVRFIRLGRVGIQVGLRVVVRGEVDEGFGEGWCVGMECEAEGGGADQVS